MRLAAQVRDGVVVLLAPKAVLVLDPAEILDLVRQRPELLARAWKRGKFLRRADATAKRAAAAVDGGKA